MTEVMKIISDPTLTYRQQLIALARLAENQDTSLPLTDEEKQMKADGILCDLNEGAAPYRPRYIIPDYRILMENGSAFLDLKKPQDLWEACAHLLIMYQHVPSITTFPVFLGNLDELLEPFVQQVSYEEAKKCLRLFLLQIDRTLTDSFVHADLGPKDSITGRIVLELTEEMQCAMPNLTLKYDPELTSDEFAQLCVTCMMKTAKPSFANHRMFVKEWGEDYAIASCYNGLKVAGGGYTLPRLRMYELSLKAKDIQDFKENVLPHYVEIMLGFMDKRIRFIVEESNFFKANFLVKEGFVKQENFTGMFGMVGLAECCNHLLGITDPMKGYGHNKQADDLGVEIMEQLQALVNRHPGLYCEGCGGHYGLHAQVGIDSDGRENSPGARIPVGAEPVMPEHIMHSARFHHYFPTGIGDIFKFEETWIQTPQAALDIIKGALQMGMRYYSGYLENNDVVRVTGYLVKKSEIAKLDAHEQSLNNVTIFGKGARDYSDALDRRIEKYEEGSR
ncbi:MAG: YjjI family glycine radical enzyme [Erysipelotrichaceae bacterium]|nr:YjjI family glycine radical enzyme [Erysipelotrichaceae bacterium]